MTSLLYLFEFFAVGMIFASGQDVLGAYNVDPSSVSISGFSSGGFMTAQLGVAYSDVFKVGFGVFAGGPYDCARNQNAFNNCMYDSTPSIDTPTANMKSWSGIGIANVANLRSRRVYMQTGSADAVIGPNVMGQLKAQVSNFVDSKKVTYITTTGAAHTFPANFDSLGDSPCDTSAAPYISNCDYDGAGAVLQWLYGDLNPRNTASLSGKVVPFAQSGSYGAPGMDATAYLYVPPSCQDSSTVCKLHVVLHGCTQAYGFIGDSFINNTGYNMWADTNDIIVLFPQAVVDNTIRRTWDGTLRNNSLGCWDWIGQYGPNTDQIGGVQMVAIVNQVRRIISGYQGNSALRSAHSMLRRYLPSGLRYILSSA